jgi:tetratricopeptide (TPR) repeat protein
VTVAVLGLAGGLAWYGLSRPRAYRPGEEIPAITRRLVRDLPEGAPAVRLVDVTADAGLDGFRTFAGDRSSQLPEDMGPGAAWGDYDNDGDDDLLLVSAGGSLEADPSTWSPCALFENRGDGSFVASEALPETRIIGMGAAWGDYTGDGWLDLVITGYDALLLFRNEQGTLVRDESLPDLPGFWAGASWADIDHDRRLDLYVCGYVQYVKDDADRARASRQFDTVVPFTLNPSSYEPQRNLLFRNLGDGGFHEVASELGVANTQGRSLGALWVDVDQDGWLDLYVANDVSDNVLFRNVEGSFTEISHGAWVADYRGAMGLAAGDYDRDGDDDIFVTHWIAQENALFASLLIDVRTLDATSEAPPDEAGGQAPEGVRFMDVADMRGLGQIALQMVGWGAAFADVDADGWLDLVVANGSTFETDTEPRTLKPQRPFLFWNRQAAHYHDLAPHSPVLQVPHVSRGLAVSDYDGDGDLDILLQHHAGGAQLLRNDLDQGSWLQVRLRSRGPDGTWTGFGDGSTVVAHAGPTHLRRTVTSISYLSQNSRTIHVGLGSAGAVDRLEVHWAGGEAQVFDNLAANRCWELREGDPEPRLVRAAPAGPVGRGRPRREPAAGGALDRQQVVEFWSRQRAAVRAMKVDDDLAAAVDLFREALAIDPGHEDSRYYLANCLAATGRVDAALIELEELVRRNPRSHRGLKRLGLMEAMTAGSPADLQQALTRLERALAINPEETGVLLCMGEVYLMLGEAGPAEQRLAWACRTNPRAVGGFFLRAYIAWLRGDEEAAGRLLASAREARGEQWQPEGTTSEGDVARQMHTDASPLSRFWKAWDGSPDPAAAFGPLRGFLDDDRRPR